jgi:hypothetical protein
MVLQPSPGQNSAVLDETIEYWRIALHERISLVFQPYIAVEVRCIGIPLCFLVLRKRGNAQQIESKEHSYRYRSCHFFSPSVSQMVPSPGLPVVVFIRRASTANRNCTRNLLTDWEIFSGGEFEERS